MDEITKLEKELAILAIGVEEHLTNACRAAEHYDGALACDVLSVHDELSAHAQEFEMKCRAFAATADTTGKDVNVCISIVKVICCLDYITMLNAKIARCVMRFIDSPTPEGMKIDLSTMTANTRTILKNALDIIFSDDIAALEALQRDYEDIHRMHEKNFLCVQEAVMPNGKCDAYYLQALSISLALDRIAYCADKIAKESRYCQ